MIHPEDLVWLTIDPDELWAMDKLILSRKLGYVCGPTGQDVPKPDWYIVRPCVNMLGLGLGAGKVWIEEETVNLPLGYFWCEWFEGRHLSIDYNYGVQTLCVEGHKADSTLTQWDSWIATDDQIALPMPLRTFAHHEWLNVEYIGGNAIEIHLRKNVDFEGVKREFIPVWEGQSTTPPDGYTYRDYPDVHGRIGAFIK
jgi:hypothetical protein